MERLDFRVATNADIPFIQDVYGQNIEKLHGIHRSRSDWEERLAKGSSTYYIACADVPVAWFRTEMEDGMLWLGMLQVLPQFQHQGIGKRILCYFEELAVCNGISRIGIHTTEDNLPARSLYSRCGYTVSEIGMCTTADGAERIGYTYTKSI